RRLSQLGRGMRTVAQTATPEPAYREFINDRWGGSNRSDLLGDFTSGRILQWASMENFLVGG
ncbi:hypothetical protein, partial [Corynebacterium dentalis]|uniref:hypothetical protein n=1 Tax=Corynebacterium dentalis TaxID=2014528 RepID=UPI00289BA304